MPDSSETEAESVYESRVRDSGVVYFPVSVDLYVFFVTASPFYLRRFSYSRSSSGSTLSVRPASRLSATLYGYQVCVICNSKSFHSFLFQLCLFHMLKMCTFYFVHISFFSFLRGVELRDFFYPKC